MARQRGLVTRSQLEATGLSRRAIGRRRERGLLYEVFPDVFSSSPALAPLALEHGALLSVGPPSALSHCTATTLWRIPPSSERSGLVHVTVWGRNCRRKGIRLHRATTWPETTTRHGLPVTTPDQTLLDIAATEPTATTEQALNEAFAQRLATRRSLLAFLARRRGQPGAARLEALVDGTGGVTRSEAERVLLRLIGRARLPRPATNARVRGYEVDALWADRGLVVEVDGYAFQASPGAFERDPANAADLQRHGLTVLRLSWRQLTSEPEATAALLGAARRV